MDLRLPSMVPGKNGFERWAWAFRNVLTDPVTWLCVDEDRGSADGKTLG